MADDMNTPGNDVPGKDTPGKDTAGKPPRRSPIWMRGLLVVSLALNLAVAGIVAGVMLRGPGPDGPPRGPSMGHAMIRALPTQDRKEIARRAHAAMRSQPVSQSSDPSSGHPPDRPPSQNLDDLLQALRAQPYDHAATSLVITMQGNERRNWAEAMQAAWLVQIRQMAPAERAAYAEAIETHRKRRAERKARWSEKQRPD